MAWQTGTHAEAPQGALCFGGPDPGTVTWYEPDEGAEDTRGDRREPPTPPAPEG